MLQSMTGYGKGFATAGQRKIQVEIRTLNSKSLDLSLKYPPILREKEAEIRNLAACHLERGKVDVWITFENLDEAQNHAIRGGLVENYYHQLKELSEKLNVEKSDLFSIIFRFPDVIRQAEEVLDEEIWEALQHALQEALEATVNFRKQEGASLSAALVEHVSSIQRRLEAVIPHEKNRLVKLRERLHRQISEWISPELVDKNRFEQEIIYYLEKFDISEEKSRLANHCKYFLETLSAAGHNGKKLNFIAQEMGREINTLGSKANDSEIQKLVVDMKDELEKIKEQVLNAL